MVYAVSDIHGCYDKYIDLLNEINFSPDDTLYVLGDVIDRGPDGFKIMLDMAQRPNVVNLLGNHEAMAMDALSRVLSVIQPEQAKPPPSNGTAALCCRQLRSVIFQQL